MPLLLATQDRFQRFRGLLDDAGYHQQSVCQRLGIKSSQEYLTLRPGTASAPPADALDILIRLFLVGDTLSTDEVRQQLSPAQIELMEELGLLVRAASPAQTCHAPVALYPARSLYIVSDRWTFPAGAEQRGFDDVVYPAVTIHTDHVVEILPSQPCDAFLDLCSGTGIMGLVAAGECAKQAWSLDITERATLFAEFNRRLNGIDNLTVACGDLYEPAGSQTFDRIAANPPYAPSRSRAEIYADGGALGDRVLRRIVEGLPKYLRPGGCFYATTGAAESDEQPFEQRLRAWLGEAHSRFDVFVIARQVFDPADMAYQAAVKTRGGPEEVAELKDLYRRSGVERFVYSSVLIQRFLDARNAVTIRRQKGRRFGAAELEWLRCWETARSHPDSADRVLDSRPLASAMTELHVTHRLRDGELAPTDFSLDIRQPFDVECRIQPWTAHLLPRCDGKVTAREHFAFLKEQNLIHPATPAREFATQLCVFISGGFLEIEGFRPPHSPDTPPPPQ